VLSCLEILAVFGALVFLRMVSLQRALGCVILGSCFLLTALVPFQDKIVKRLTGDFEDSVQFRENGVRASLAAIAERPMLGFGLNNTACYLVKYLPEFDWALSTEQFATRVLHLRAPISLGNGFLHLLEETGILGFLGFVVLVFGALVSGVRSVARTVGEPRAVCCGLMIGMLGVLGEQFVDTPLWVDPVLFTFVLFIGMLNVAGVLFPKAGAGGAVSA
jgi:O-antigen ligase